MSVGLAARFPNASGESDDPDGDGVSNRDEWLAGTDPTQRGSRLEMELAPRPTDLSDADHTPIPARQHAVYFRSAPHRYYGVQRSFSVDGPWELQATKVAAENTTQTRVLLPKPDAQAFYRVVVLP